MKKILINIVYVITILGIVVFSIYITKYICTLKKTIFERDALIANLSVENYELKETIKETASFDLQENDSILRSCFPEKATNTLILRLTEDMCMNCYYNSLQRAIMAYHNSKEKFDLKILGKYRFNANLKNDIKDLVPSQIETINSSKTFALDELSAPYLLYLNNNGKLSHIYVLPKNDIMNFVELYKCFN